jgi:MYXO-CTERM domain-containing protein
MSAALEALMSNSIRVLTFSASAMAFAFLGTSEAEACGGFFCNNQPVIQTGEQIIFGVDHDSQTTTAIININYQGSATEFAWLLPLQVNPSEILAGPSQAFVVSNRLTQSRFQITEVETRGVCGPNNLGFATSDSAAPRSQNAEGGSDGDVNVLQQSQVGPYDTVVLEGSDPEKVFEWLIENGYRLTDEMKQPVIPYVAKGDVLLALKLSKDQDSGDIQPIELVLKNLEANATKAPEACIPLRLTAIAAQADMDVTALVLSNEGRAIPVNYNHVQINMAKIDWMRGGNNYRQIVAEAADEGSGNAFTTEYSGSTDIFKEALYAEGQYDVARLRQQTDLGDFLQELQNQGLRFRPELRATMARFFPEVLNCRGCPASRFRGTQIDSNLAVDELQERVIDPERRVQAMFDAYKTATRLYTLISPEEMTIDPILDFDSSLPDVSNVHEAKMIQYCGVGGSPGSAGVEVELTDGTVISFDSNGNRDRSILDSMPAASRIEQLKEGTLIKDNRGAIQELLEEHNVVNGLATCSCEATNTSEGTLLSLGLLGLLALFVRKRKLS